MLGSSAFTMDLLGGVRIRTYDSARHSTDSGTAYC